MKFDFNVPVEQTRWIVEPLIPQGQMVLMLAQAGVGKSLIVEDLAVHLVYEEPFCGLATQFGDVLIIDQDTPEEVLKKRLIKFSQAFKGREPKHNLFVESMQGLAIDNNTLSAVINDYHTCNMIIIDSLHSVCGRLNPNSTADMAALARLKSRCLTTDRTIIINHHISEKVPLTVEALMTDNTHAMAMGNSSIIQQADSYYVVGASASDGVTNHLYIRPIAKRVSIPSTPLVLRIINPSPNAEQIVFETNYVLNLSDVEADCMTLFSEYPSDRTVKEVYEAIGQKHGMTQIREALASLNSKGLLILSRQRSNLFRYRKP